MEEVLREEPLSQRGSLALRCLLGLVALLGGLALVLGLPWDGRFLPYRIDLDVYRLGGQAFLDGVDLYGRLPDTAVGLNLPFTYPPIAAILFVPFALIPYWLANLVFGMLTVVCLYIVIRRVLAEVLGSRRLDPTWAGVACFTLLIWATPVRETISFGQVNVMLMTLVVVDVFAGRGRWWQGMLIGLAISIKLTPAVFLGYFLVRRDWRALLMSIGSALAFTLAGFLLAPSSSVRYWTEALRDPSRIGGLSYVSNQSINGFLMRLGSGGDQYWFVVCASIGFLLLIVMRRPPRGPWKAGTGGCGEPSFLAWRSSIRRSSGGCPTRRAER